MEVKKTEKADLENKRGIFLQIGFVIALLLIWGTFEWTTKESGVKVFDELENTEIEEEIIPITRQQEATIMPPPSPSQIIELSIVEDNIEIDDDYIAEDVEADRNTTVEAISLEEEEGDYEGEIFMVVEEKPSFSGKGELGFLEYIQKNLKYPEAASDNGIEGTVYIEFVVNKNGKLSDAVVRKSVHPALDKEALRVVMASPPWEPGKQRGKPVRVQFIFPIRFQMH